MTRKERTKREIEDKIVSLYIKLHKRKTEKISRKNKIKRTIESFKAQLQKIVEEETTSNQQESVSTPKE